MDPFVALVESAHGTYEAFDKVVAGSMHRKAGGYCSIVHLPKRM
jgi:hypothetical protein